MIIDIRKNIKKIYEESSISREDIEKQMKKVAAYLQLQRKVNEMATLKK
ncbi:hypothetical protein [Fulvivirga sp. M361]|nr:hypothetical protein [Fulvivirga sp. M361]